MYISLRPPHLLPLDHPFADHLIHRRLDEARNDYVEYEEGRPITF
jgi:hypothetical protein